MTLVVSLGRKASQLYKIQQSGNEIWLKMQMLRLMHAEINLFKGDLKLADLKSVMMQEKLSLKEIMHWSQVLDIFLKEFVSMLSLDSMILSDFLIIAKEASEIGMDSRAAYKKTIRRGLEEMVEARGVVDDINLSDKKSHDVNLIVVPKVTSVRDEMR